MSSSSTTSLQSIIHNAERLANRLKDHQALADRILAEAEGVNNQLETMRQFKDDLDLLNSLAREKSNAQMIHTIYHENPQLREMHSENIRLRVSLEDHQRALEHIMTKYREHSQIAIENSKVNFQELFRGETEKSIIIRRQEEKIQEMIAIMQKAALLEDDDFINEVKKDRENISRLVVENRGLREILAISKKFGCTNVQATQENGNGNGTATNSAIDSTKSETELLEKTEKISVETQTDENANKC